MPFKRRKLAIIYNLEILSLFSLSLSKSLSLPLFLSYFLSLSLSLSLIYSLSPVVGGMLQIGSLPFLWYAAG